MVEKIKLNKSKAKTSMVLGIISIILSLIPIVGLLSGIFAIIFYVKSNVLIIKYPNKYGGGKFALSGFITGVIGVVFSLSIAIIVAILTTLLAVT